MPQSKLQTTQLLNSLVGRSKLDRWTKGPQAACDRIYQGIVIPHWQPSFQMFPEAKVFAIGSCFARSIETELLNLGVQVTSTGPDSELMEIRSNLQLGLLNKYTPVSIHQELAWAAGITAFPEQGYIEHQGKYLDPYLREQTPRGDLAFMQSRRSALQQYFAQAFEADLVIVTLGLTETWYDRTTKLALTEAPSPRLIKQHPKRFGLKFLLYQDCIALLKSICTLLQEYGKPNLKIVFTLSPVALQRTFTGQDVIVANMMSKSTLRSAIGELAARVDGVDYFPSYEAAMLSDPLMVWQADRRNVTDLIVAHIMDEFTCRYGFKPAQTPEAVQAKLQHTTRARLGIAQKNLSQLSKLLRQMEGNLESPM
jgi:hypothetical protein